MNLTEDVVARRALLVKAGCPDIRLEVRRTPRSEFEYVVDGKTRGLVWQKLTPNQAMSGNIPQFDIDQVWRTCVSNFPGYSVTVVEDGTI
jgi:hypothetical protein